VLISGRKKLLINSSLIIVAIAPIVLYAYEYGPDPGYTSAPGDNPTGCMASGCHTDVPNTGPGSVKIVASGGTTYVPGQTQQIQVTITDTTEHKYGFELTARVDSNPKLVGAGTLTATDANTVVFNCVYTPPYAGSCPSGNTLQWISHNITGYDEASNKAPSYTYTFNWTPPATNVGTVTLYAAGNAGSGALVVNLTHDYLTKLQLSPNPIQFGGSLYVAGFFGKNVSVVPPGGGNATVFVGNLQAPSSPGDLVGGPTGIAFDGNGGFFLSRFSYSQNQSDILHFSQSGEYQTFASGLPGSIGIALDKSGYLYVANQTGGTISKCSPAGSCIQLASIPGAIGVAFNTVGQLFAVGNQQVYSIAPDGTTTLYASLPGTSLAALAFSPVTGDLFVLDQPTGSVLVYHRTKLIQHGRQWPDHPSWDCV
jgi:hypothetical protein